MSGQPKREPAVRLVWREEGGYLEEAVRRYNAAAAGLADAVAAVRRRVVGAPASEIITYGAIVRMVSAGMPKYPWLHWKIEKPGAAVLVRFEAPCDAAGTILHGIVSVSTVSRSRMKREWVADTRIPARGPTTVERVKEQLAVAEIMAARVDRLKASLAAIRGDPDPDDMREMLTYATLDTRMREFSKHMVEAEPFVILANLESYDKHTAYGIDLCRALFAAERGAPVKRGVE